MGSDAFRVPQKTICNPEPDGPSVRGPPNSSRGLEKPKPVPGSLTDPLDAAAAADARPSCLGDDRTPPQRKEESGLDQTCQN